MLTLKLIVKTSLGVIRLLNNGKYDNEFGENGVFKYNYQNKNNHITALCIVKNEIIAIGRNRSSFKFRYYIV